MKNVTLLWILVSLLSCGHLFYQPHKKIYTTPAQYQLNYDQITFSSLDKTLLRGWHIKTNGPSPKGIIVHFHGNAENRSTHFFQLAWLSLEGYDLFIPDYRGYGDSEGESTRAGIYYDSHAFIHQGLQLFKQRKAQNFIVWGQSLGGNIAARVVYDHQDEVDLLILDSTFDSYQRIAFQKLKDFYLSFIFSPLAFLLTNDQFSANNVLHKIKTPTMVIHGKKDHIIPFQFGENIYQKLKSRKIFIEFSDGKHLRAFSTQKNRASFLNKMERFIQDK